MNKSDDLRHIYDASLFSTSDLDTLLHEVLKQTRELLNAEAGSIYIKNDNHLCFNVFQNDTFSYEDIYKQFYALKDVQLPLSEAEKYLAVEAFSSQKIIIIDDVYKAEEYDFLGVKEFDKKFGYRTHSIITAPLIHPISNRGLGIVQILNKKENEKYLAFNEKDKTLLSMVCSFIALAVSKAQKDIIQLKKLNDKLALANANLEVKVKEEIEKNEKKTTIIHNQSTMVSMGEMIGNIAHQWRQPLSSISTVASGLKLKLDMGTTSQEELGINLRKIVDTTQHLSQTIDDFRNFYKVNKQEELFNLEIILKRCSSIIEAALHMNEIKLIADYDSTLDTTGLRNEFSQTIINILSNAKDALIEKVDISNKRLIFIDLYSKDDKIIIKIKDNAYGIPKDIMSNVFQQHFTTKEENGNGIGLFMSKQIIDEHMGGLLEVENITYEYQEETYTGAQFTITLNQIKN